MELSKTQPTILEHGAFNPKSEIGNGQMSQELERKRIEKIETIPSTVW
jgi:hypothetical protein